MISIVKHFEGFIYFQWNEKKYGMDIYLLRNGKWIYKYNPTTWNVGIIVKILAYKFRVHVPLHSFVEHALGRIQCINIRKTKLGQLKEKKKKRIKTSILVQKATIVLMTITMLGTPTWNGMASDFTALSCFMISS